VRVNIRYRYPVRCNELDLHNIAITWGSEHGNRRLYCVRRYRNTVRRRLHFLHICGFEIIVHFGIVLQSFWRVAFTIKIIWVKEKKTSRTVVVLYALHSATAVIVSDTVADCTRGGGGTIGRECSYYYYADGRLDRAIGFPRVLHARLLLKELCWSHALRDVSRVSDRARFRLSYLLE